MQQSSSRELNGKAVKRRKHVSIAFEDEDAGTSASSKSTLPDAGIEKTDIATSSRRRKRCPTLPEWIISARIVMVSVCC